MIRGLKSYFGLIVLLLIVAVFSSCTKTEYVEVPVTPDAPEEKAPTYTIMLYGVGGGNLDRFFNYNLGQLEAAGKQERVNFRALFKYSKKQQSQKNYEGTRLLTLTEKEGLKSEKKYESTYRMDNPAHLTEFIKETKKLMPADKYILIFWNHGSEFTVSDKLVQDSYPEETVSDKMSSSSQSRAVLFDDNVDDKIGLSVFEMEKGIKDSGIKLDLLYLDACNMGMIENYSQLKDLTHYMMAAFQPTPGLGGDYAKLQFCLQNNSSLENAIQDYVPKCVKGWEYFLNKWYMDSESLCDMECYDMTYMDEFLGYTQKALSCYMKMMDGVDDSEQTILKKRYLEQLNIKEDEQGYTYLAEGENISADICFALNTFTQKNISGTISAIDGAFSTYVALMNDCLKKMTVAAATINLPKQLDGVSMGVNWPTIKQASLASKEGFLNAYRNTVFDQWTHWSNHLFKYGTAYIIDCQSCIFVKDNGLFNSSDETYYLPQRDDFLYTYKVNWYFDDSVLAEDKKEEAHAFLERINKQYENLSEMVLPLTYTDVLIPELESVVKNTPLLGTFKKYASKVHVDITISSIASPDGDPDLKKYPLERTETIDYSFL